MLDYSIPIPTEYWNTFSEGGKLTDDKFNGKGLCIYTPKDYNPEKKYDIFYFKMGTNNPARQFWTFKGQTSHFEYVIDNLIAKGEIKPCIIVSIDGNKPNTGWLQDNAQGLINYVESKYSTFNNPLHRAIGGWSLGSIEVRTMLVNDKKNDFYKLFNWYDIQSGYNANKMDKIDPLPFVGCVAGSKDDGGCITFTKTCDKYFKANSMLNKNTAQIVNGYKHYIKYQLNYFYNAIKYFFN